MSAYEGTVGNGGKVIGEVYGEAVAEATTIQYGGSMNAKNCEELLSKKDVDGGLIGGGDSMVPITPLRLVPIQRYRQQGNYADIDMLINEETYNVLLKR